MTKMAWGAGLTTETPDGSTLDAWYRWLGWGEYEGGDFDDELAGTDRTDDVRRVVIRPVRMTIDVDEPPASAADVYLRLHLLSHRLAAPNTINLDGIFGLLANVAWTNLGPVAVDQVDRVRFVERAAGRHLTVYGQDKFPRMTDYVSPPGVRIADADRVRLGAHLADGTTVMHEGFCNFNAGTLGTRWSRDASRRAWWSAPTATSAAARRSWARLSGGGKERISVGERTLIGANAGIGISLGDDCVVEAGLYLTAGTLVKLPDGEVVKALELSGIDNMLFIRHAQTGAVEARQRSGSWGGLNAALHHN